MKPEQLSSASEKRRKLERELIGSLAGNCAETIEAAGCRAAACTACPWRVAMTVAAKAAASARRCCAP